MPCQGPGRRCSTLCEKPLMSTLLRASSHISQELSFHTWVAMLYSSISGSCTGQVPSDECVLASCPCLPSPASPHALPTPAPTSAQPPNSVGLANWPAMLYHQGAAPTQETPPPNPKDPSVLGPARQPGCLLGSDLGEVELQGIISGQGDHEAAGQVLR